MSMYNAIEKDYKLWACPRCGAGVPPNRVFKLKIKCEFCGNVFTMKGMERELKMYENGISQLSGGDYAAARSIFLQLTELMPNDWRVWLGLVLGLYGTNCGTCNEERSRVLTLLKDEDDPDIRRKIGNLYINTADSITRLTQQINQKNEIISGKMNEYREYDRKDARNTLLCWFLAGLAALSFILFWRGLAIGSPIAGLGILSFFACVVPLFKALILNQGYSPDLQGMRDQLAKLDEECTELEKELSMINESPNIDYYIDILKE